MERYTVRVVSAATATTRPVLLVPFAPSALIAAFLEELFRRLARQNIPLRADTHVCTLHLDTETGAVVDCEDVISDVIYPGDTLFAVFSPVAATEKPAQPPAQTAALAIRDGAGAGDVLSMRVITAASAKNNKSELAILSIPASSSVKELHDQVADHLNLPRSSSSIDNECNCTLAKKLSDGSSSPTSFLVAHGKSKVLRLNVPEPTEVDINAALRAQFGGSVSDLKHVAFNGAERQESAFDTLYSKTPVVSICAKHRHTPRHAKVTQEDGSEQHRRLLDLHTSECPINRACQDITLHDSGIGALAIDGVIDIYAVHRAVIDNSPRAAEVGKSAIFRYRSHWEPAVKQSDRGIAMLLSSLRVFASNVQEMNDQRKDAIYHVFDLLSGFPPALRSLHLLVQGRSVTSMESSALSCALFEILQSYIPTEIIGTDQSRLFEGGRLLFGFILEKARVLTLAEAAHEGHAAAVAKMPYLSAFSAVDLQDVKTMEAVIHIVRTDIGNMEQSLYKAFQPDGVLSTSHLRPDQFSSIECHSDLSRVAILTGGASTEVTVFSGASLANDYRYPDNGYTPSAFDVTELSELDHIAALCGRNGLAVHKPSQLASAVAPCLTFDRNAHLAVYNGPQASSQPGDESGIFRPKHGNEAMDATVVEQLIAPILSRYEADGTSVFDMLGGSTVRRLQAPDEIIMFAVDCSASMKSATDFLDVNNDDLQSEHEDLTAETLVEGHFFSRSTFDEVKEMLSQHESFEDMLAIVADATRGRSRQVATEVIGLVRNELSQKIVANHAKVVRLQGLPGYGSRLALNEMVLALNKVKQFWAALRTNESSLVDFLIFRATTSSEVATRWLWYAGQDVPTGAPAGIIPSLPGHITAVPNRLQCPISHGLMEDAVTAADGFIYSRAAITQWFSIRKSSPMTGLELQDTTLRSNDAISASVAAWTLGNDTLSRPALSPNFIRLTFNSRFGRFDRDVDSSITITSLYKIAFSGFKARFTAFQLAKDERVLSLSQVSLQAAAFHNGDEITVRLADDGDMVVSNGGTATSRTSGEMCLIKVYDRGANDSPCFSYWIRRDTPLTMNSILFKFWRFKFSSGGLPRSLERQIWTGMRGNGDGYASGSPRDSSDRLSTFLNRSHCSGHLHAEPLFNAEDATQEVGNIHSTDSPLVLKVSVSQAWSEKRGRDRGALSRLDVLKQMFEALVNRMIAYNFKTHVGLVTFASAASVTNGISHVLENFRQATSTMQASGDTALWDALSLSLDQVQEASKKYPAAKKRVIVISDGVNTKSTTNTCEDIAWKMKENGVAVDTVSLGQEQSKDLKTISWLLGCFSFHPTSLANALAICEMEPFLSAVERPDIVPRSKATNRLAFRSSFLNARFSARDTVVTGDHFPARKEHENLSDEFVQLSANICRSNATTNPQSGARSNFRILRVMKEINQLVAKDHPQYDIYVSERNMAFWKVVVSGPEGSPYSAGNFLLYLDMRSTYPTFHPEARFITKMIHPNVNAHGRVCHPLFGRDWTTDTNMTTVLDTIYGLLFQAEVSDPVSTLSTLEYHADGVEFAEAVRDHVQRHAMKSRAEWQAELLGEVDEHEESDENYDEDPNQDAGAGSEIDDFDGNISGGDDYMSDY